MDSDLNALFILFDRYRRDGAHRLCHPDNNRRPLPQCRFSTTGRGRLGRIERPQGDLGVDDACRGEGTRMVTGQPRVIEGVDADADRGVRFLLTGRTLENRIEKDNRITRSYGSHRRWRERINRRRSHGRLGISITILTVTRRINVWVHMRSGIIRCAITRIPVRRRHDEEYAPHHHQKSDNGSKPLKSEGTIGRLIGLRVTELPGGRRFPHAARVYGTPQKHGNEKHEEDDLSKRSHRFLLS